MHLNVGRRPLLFVVLLPGFLPSFQVGDLKVRSVRIRTVVQRNERVRTLNASLSRIASVSPWMKWCNSERLSVVLVSPSFMPSTDVLALALLPAILVYCIGFWMVILVPKIEWIVFCSQNLNFGKPTGKTAASPHFVSVAQGFAGVGALEVLVAVVWRHVKLDAWCLHCRPLTNVVD